MEDPVYTLTTKQLIETLERAITAYHRQHTVYHWTRSMAAQRAINAVMSELKPDRQLQAEDRS